MSLASMRVGDVVSVDGRLGFVEGHPARGRLTVKFAHGARELRTVKSRDVEAHWRRAGRSRGAS